MRAALGNANPLFLNIGINDVFLVIEVAALIRMDRGGFYYRK